VSQGGVLRFSATDRSPSPRCALMSVMIARSRVRRWQFRDEQGDVLSETDLRALWGDAGPCVGIERSKLQRALLPGVANVRCIFLTASEGGCRPQRRIASSSARPTLSVSYHRHLPFLVLPGLQQIDSMTMPTARVEVGYRRSFCGARNRSGQT
jgi:hypothetical protein